ncbi:bZIP transcription factor 18-like [Miscanthus floridulus]|uniref:bZIP transcription factor 18-like n=1 Tax=Miscanthus floridulus TaxID=154761 RepID=UPI003459B331
MADGACQSSEFGVVRTSGPQSPLGEREASQQPARPQHPPLLSLPSPGHRHRRARSEVAFCLPDDLGLGGPDGDAFDEIGSEDDLFSTFMDIEKISSSGPSNRDRDRAAKTSSLLRPKHRHSSSVDGSGLFFSPGIGGARGEGCRGVAGRGAFILSMAEISLVTNNAIQTE